METWIKYIGTAAQRLVSHNDLVTLGADLSKIEHVAEGDVLSFVHGAAVKVEDEVAHILTTHPSLAGEFASAEDPATETAPAPVAPLTPTAQSSSTQGSPQTEATAPAEAPAAEEVAPNAGSAS